MKIKRIALMLLAGILALGLAACAPEPAETAPAKPDAAKTTVEVTTAATTAAEPETIELKLVEMNAQNADYDRSGEDTLESKYQKLAAAISEKTPDLVFLIEVNTLSSTEGIRKKMANASNYASAYEDNATTMMLYNKEVFTLLGKGSKRIGAAGDADGSKYERYLVWVELLHKAFVLGVVERLSVEGASLDLRGPGGQCHVDDRPGEAGTFRPDAADADGTRLREDDAFHGGDVGFAADHAQKPCRPVFLHEGRHVMHVQRAGVEQGIHRQSERFSGGVVDVGLDNRDPGGRGVSGGGLLDQHRAKDVRHAEVAFARAEADLLDREGFRQGGTCPDRGGDRGARRCDHFALHGEDAEREPGGGCDVRYRGDGDRKLSVLALHEPGPFVQSRYDDVVDAEVVEADRGGCDVDDGVDGADFVEMHLFDRLAVRFGFRFGDDAKYLQCESAGAGRQAAAVQDGSDIRQIPVHVGMMVVPVLVMVFMAFMRMIVFLMAVMPVFVVQLDVERTGVDTVRVRAGDRDGIPLHIQAFEGGKQFDLRSAEVEQGSHGHVAADAGRAFEVKDGFAHGRFPCVASELMRAARYPAPNPLSMFTTDIPSAQELSMVRSGAMPPNDAP